MRDSAHHNGFVCMTPGANRAKLLKLLEATSGFEPEYTDLQSDNNWLSACKIYTLVCKNSGETALLRITEHYFAHQFNRADEALERRTSPNHNERSRFEMAELSPITAARFWSKVAVLKSQQECWLWTGARGTKGYGNLKIGRETVTAHRVAYALANGRFPPAGKVVRHKCDNPQCCNPFHLEIGTVADNSRDMIERGRWRGGDQSGAANGNAKLKPGDLPNILRRIAAGETNVSIAADYPVSHAMISKIRRGHHWQSS